MPYPLVSVTDAPYAVAPVVSQMGYLGAKKVVAPRPPAPNIQALKNKLAQKKAARCANRQSRLQAACAAHQQRLSRRHLKPKAMARLTATLSKRCAAKMANQSRRCSVPTALSTANIVGGSDDNIVSAADFADAMSDWKSCMTDQKTCATDDCGLQSDCNDPDKDYQKDCVSDWKSCMSDDKTCDTDYCGTKPVVGLSGLGAFDSQNMLVLIAGAALLWYFLSKKKGK